MNDGRRAGPRRLQRCRHHRRRRRLYPPSFPASNPSLPSFFFLFLPSSIHPFLPFPHPPFRCYVSVSVWDTNERIIRRPTKASCWGWEEREDDDALWRQAKHQTLERTRRGGRGVCDGPIVSLASVGINLIQAILEKINLMVALSAVHHHRRPHSVLFLLASSSLPSIFFLSFSSVLPVFLSLLFL